jgi:putative ABC transport system permease protein
MSSVLDDVRYAIRGLFKSPTFALVALATLGLGIGANTGIFSVVNAVLLRPLPYADADRLVVAGMSLPDFRDVREGVKAFDDISVWASNLYNLEAGDDTEQVTGAVVSERFFPMLGVRPVAGRTAGAGEERQALVVISHRLWTRRFAGDPAAIGQTLRLSGDPHTIVGVMPPEFQLPVSHFELWVPMDSAMNRAPEQVDNRSLRIFRTIARLREGTTLAAAQAEVDAVSSRLATAYPDSNTGVRFVYQPLQERLVGDVRLALLVLFGVVGFVLLIACANVASLSLARTTARQREMAVRVALGAGRWRLVRQMLTESLVLAAIGGALGLMLAAWMIDSLVPLVADRLPRADSIALDGMVLLFTAAASAVTGVVFGLAPALQASRTNLNESLKEGGRGTAGSARGQRLRAGLVVAEIALALMAVIGAGLLLRSFSELTRVDAGFDPERVLTLNVQMIDRDAPARAVTAARILERLATLPGVEAAGGNTGLPPMTAQRGTRFEVEGQPDANPDERFAYFMAASPGYFRALGSRLVGGRAFDERDRSGAQPVVIVSSGLARRVFGDEDPVGRRLKLVNREQSPEWRTIVGVVGNVRYNGLDDGYESAIYTPFSQTPFLWTYLMIRTAGDPALMAASVKAAVREVDPALSPAAVRPMTELVADSVAQPRVNATMVGMFAALALLLAAAGVHGLLSYSVEQRRHEIGVRVALGAKPGDVVRVVLGQTLRLATVGVGLGLLGAFAFGRVMSGLLFEVSATDPATFAAVSALLALVALAASYIPARGAMRVDPMAALRAE